MAQRKRERDYEEGKADAMRSLAPNPIRRSRESQWAYDAGWRDGMRDLLALKRKLDNLATKEGN